MNIDYNFNRIELSCLQPGQVFFERHRFYMITDVCSEDQYACVDLNDGHIEHFGETDVVQYVDAELWWYMDT